MTIGYDASRAFVDQKTGTETYSYHLLLALAKSVCQHQFWVYVRPSYKPGLESGAYLSENPQFRFQTINWPLFWTQGRLALETWRHPVDVLFIPAHIIPFLKNPKVSAVVTVHDLALEFLPQYKGLQRVYLGWWMERLRARLATHIIAVSEATKKDVMEKLGVPEEKVSVVYEGLSPSFVVADFPSTSLGTGSPHQINKIKQKYGISGDYILFVGTVQPRKNLVRLIEAFSILKVRDLQLVIAGKRGWIADEIYKAPQQFRVGERVKFLGYVSADDLLALYAGACVFCLPSLHEGFGLPVLESMAAGTPVVISNVSSLPEVGGKAAVYVDPYDVEDIARGLSQVLHWNTSEYQRRVEEGKKWAQNFTWEKAAQETLKILEKVVTSG